MQHWAGLASLCILSLQDEYTRRWSRHCTRTMTVWQWSGSRTETPKGKRYSCRSLPLTCCGTYLDALIALLSSFRLDKPPDELTGLAFRHVTAVDISFICAASFHLKEIVNRFSPATRRGLLLSISVTKCKPVVQSWLSLETPVNTEPGNYFTNNKLQRSLDVESLIG